ncbi:efflux RND transporter periplasmic adaptor subunit [Roseovarius sp. S4756]|uniref:efflux RND transporter periplasmic adaptor subunit n=1 Tax=Roseovarius maritimus TaxID=3342637 RepID=UPI003B67371B
MAARQKTGIDQIVAQRGGGHSVRRWLIGLALVAAVLGGGWLWLVRGGAEDGALYSAQAVVRSPITVTVTATGSVEPTNLVEISSELSGTIRSVAVDYNSPVTSGQVLAELDTDKLEAQLEHSRATLAAREARIKEAQATLTESRDDYDRATELDRRGVTTTQTVQAARAKLTRAEAALTSAEADMRVAAADLKVDEANLAKACICSPIDGVVLERNVDVGQIVASSLQAPVLFSIAEDLTRMELQVDIDEADIGKVKVGDAAEFTVEAYQDRSFPAEISELRYASQTIDGVVTYTGILTIDNADLLLRPGMTATAEITVAQIEDALALPNAALRFAPPAEPEEEAERSGLLGMILRPPSRDTASTPESTSGMRTVWVLEAGEITPAEITVGASDGMLTQITGGPLSEGDRVVVDMATE